MQSKAVSPPTFYRAEEPYPPVRVAGQNLQYARLLSQDAFSQWGELSTVTQYLYDSWITQARYEPLSKALKGIAEVEMHHLETFGQLICLLGGNPSYIAHQNRRAIPWGSGCLSFCKDPVALLERAASGEERVINHYLRQCTLITDEGIVAILLRIVADERVHLQIFRRFLEEFHGRM